ncbi:MAG: site-specific integrase [bacterium]|nr:site-specific integrase [bacterium]
MTRKEVAALLRAARQEPQARLHLPLFILTALYTGARREAILSLRWPQVDLERGRIDLNPPGRRRTSKGRPVIPIPRRLAIFLRLARLRGSEMGFVVNRDGLPVKNVRRGFATACRKASLHDVTPHTLRHTAGTWMAQRGVPLFDIAGYLGHSHARTSALYAHHSPEYLSRAVAAFD